MARRDVLFIQATLLWLLYGRELRCSLPFWAQLGPSLALHLVRITRQAVIAEAASAGVVMSCIHVLDSAGDLLRECLLGL